MSMDDENIDDDSKYKRDDSSRDGNVPEDVCFGVGPKPQSDDVVVDKTAKNNYSPDTVTNISIVESLPLKIVRGMSFQEDDEDQEEEDDDEFEYEYSEDDDYIEENDDGNIPTVGGHKHTYSSIVTATGTVNPIEPPSKFRRPRIRKLPTGSFALPLPYYDDQHGGVTSFGNHNKYYQTISTKVLIPLMEQRIVDTVEALSIPAAAAVPLLYDWQWNRQALLEAYMNDPEHTLRKAGVTYRCLPVSEAVTATKPACDDDCPICMESLSDVTVQSLSMPCGHTFCLSCWHGYLDNIINQEGATCMAASCPDASCQERLSQDEVEKAASTLLAKFKVYQLDSFAGAIGRWCPGPGCDRIVCKTLSETPTDSCVADCHECGTMFCIDCMEEPHGPVSCRNLQLWKEKDRDEAETMKWMTVNTKNCPNCSSRIEKNGGCQYMTCQKCSHGFCWLCLGTHHVWQCNAYKQDDDAENEVLRTKNELERYIHYYSRFQGHNSAQKFAVDQLKGKSCTVDKVESNEEENTQTCTPSDQPLESNTISPLDLPDFMVAANRQLVECRRVLKYTYVFAFFHFADRKLKLSQECFESHQGTLEGLTEGLSMATEKPLKDIDRQDVINRTCAIGAFIKNVLAYIDEVVDENG